MSDLYEARNSIYCYKDSDVLVNKFDIHDNKKLEELHACIRSVVDTTQLENIISECLEKDE